MGGDEGGEDWELEGLSGEGWQGEGTGGCGERGGGEEKEEVEGLGVMC